MARRKAKRIAAHYAGRAGDGEFAVITVVSAGDGQHAYCTRPCPQCPWRKDAPIGAFPPEAFRHSARTAYDMAQTVFSCHMATAERPATCAGFLLRGALHSLSIRMATLMGRLDLDRVGDGGAELYECYTAMAIANGVAPDDPALKPCRSNGYD